MRVIGLGFDWTDGNYEMVFCNLCESVGEERAREILKEANFPEGITVDRIAELDKPLLIKFEDGDILGIDFGEASSVRISLNTIPWDIKSDIRQSFHANRLFANLLGKKISGVEISSVLENPDAVFTGSHGITLNEQSSYISKLAISCYTDKYKSETLSLVFSAWLDYGYVCLVDWKGHRCQLPATDIEYVTEGFLNLYKDDNEEE